MNYISRKKFLAAVFIHVAIATTAFAQFQNVMIDNDNTWWPPSEPTIIINPKNTNQLVGGCNIDKVYRSNDAGVTWTTGTLASSYGVWGDPCTVVDTSGNFYYFHLQSVLNATVVGQKSTDGGITWSNGTYPPDNMNAMWADKEWACVDWSNSQWANSIYLTWIDGADSLRLVFSKSADGGQTWSTPVRISHGTVNNPPWPDGNVGSVPAVGPNGEIYITWSARSIRFNKSLDGGLTWLNNPLYVDTIVPGWDYGGNIAGMMRALAIPSIACDMSGGPHTGNIYICWADQRNGINNTDVFMSRSTNGGSTWTTMRINNDVTQTHQFVPWLTVDQTTGYIYVVFYDRRNYPNNQLTTDVYLAYSTDGGSTFNNVMISSSPFTPNAMYGDYINITAHNNIIRPIWMREDAGTGSVWTALIDYGQLSMPDEASQTSLVQIENYPNPFSSSAVIAFFLPEDHPEVSLRIYDLLGNESITMINGEKKSMGWHHVVVDAGKYNLPSGIYYFTLQTSSGSKTKKVILAK